MIDSVGRFAARDGIGVAAAADGNEGDGFGILFFDRFLGAAGPIAMNLIEAARERSAVAGAIDEQRRPLAPGTGHSEHRESVIHGAATSPPILRKADRSPAPRKL